MNIEKIKRCLGDKSIPEIYEALMLVNCSHNQALSIIEIITDVRLVRFEDLKFINHPVSLGRLGKRIQAKGEINGKWYSVVGGANLCGDGINTFEMWTEKMENVGMSPAPYISKEEVEKIIIDLY
jgi:hypothetical protein